VFATGNIAAPVEKDIAGAMARNKKRMPFFSKYNDTVSQWQLCAHRTDSPSDSMHIYRYNT